VWNRVNLIPFILPHDSDEGVRNLLFLVDANRSTSLAPRAMVRGVLGLRL
jgi:hypothetical protein